MAATPKPNPKSAEEQAQESLKRLAMFAGGAMVVLSLFASCLGKRHRAQPAADIPVSVPAVEASPAESAADNQPQDLAPLPVPDAVGPVAENAPGASMSADMLPPSAATLGNAREDGTWSGGPPAGLPSNPGAPKR